MEDIGLVTKIILVVIVLHLIVGFGYAIYMLAPRKGDKVEGDDES
jgi:hypothetical protein